MRAIPKKKRKKERKIEKVPVFSTIPHDYLQDFCSFSPGFPFLLTFSFVSLFPCRSFEIELNENHVSEWVLLGVG